jgi:hypothetical protein
MWKVRTIYGIKHGWSVDRLRDLSVEFPVRGVPSGSIFEFETACWFDNQYSPTCREVKKHLFHIQGVAITDSIILSADGHVMDRLQRVDKAPIQGKTHIQAMQFTKDPEPEGPS